MNMTVVKVSTFGEQKFIFIDFNSLLLKNNGQKNFPRCHADSLFSVLDKLMLLASVSKWRCQFSLGNAKANAMYIPLTVCPKSCCVPRDYRFRHVFQSVPANHPKLLLATLNNLTNGCCFWEAHELWVAKMKKKRSLRLASDIFVSFSLLSLVIHLVPFRCEWMFGKEYMTNFNRMHRPSSIFLLHENFGKLDMY